MLKELPTPWKLSEKNHEITAINSGAVKLLETIWRAQLTTVWESFWKIIKKKTIWKSWASTLRTETFGTISNCLEVDLWNQNVLFGTLPCSKVDRLHRNGYKYNARSDWVLVPFVKNPLRLSVFRRHNQSDLETARWKVVENTKVERV